MYFNSLMYDDAVQNLKTKDAEDGNSAENGIKSQDPNENEFTDSENYEDLLGDFSLHPASDNNGGSDTDFDLSTVAVNKDEKQPEQVLKLNPSQIIDTPDDVKPAENTSTNKADHEEIRSVTNDIGLEEFTDIYTEYDFLNTSGEGDFPQEQLNDLLEFKKSIDEQKSEISPNTSEIEEIQSMDLESENESKVDTDEDVINPKELSEEETVLFGNSDVSNNAENDDLLFNQDIEDANNLDPSNQNKDEEVFFDDINLDTTNSAEDSSFNIPESTDEIAIEDDWTDTETVNNVDDDATNLLLEEAPSQTEDDATNLLIEGEPSQTEDDATNLLLEGEPSQTDDATNLLLEEEPSPADDATNLLIEGEPSQTDDDATNLFLEEEPSQTEDKEALAGSSYIPDEPPKKTTEEEPFDFLLDDSDDVPDLPDNTSDDLSEDIFKEPDSIPSNKNTTPNIENKKSLSDELSLFSEDEFDLVRKMTSYSPQKETSDINSGITENETGGKAPFKKKEKFKFSKEEMLNATDYEKEPSEELTVNSKRKHSKEKETIIADLPEEFIDLTKNDLTDESMEESLRSNRTESASQFDIGQKKSTDTQSSPKRKLKLVIGEFDCLMDEEQKLNIGDSFPLLNHKSKNIYVQVDGEIVGKGILKKNSLGGFEVKLIKK